MGIIETMTSETHSIVYQVTNRINGKRYIGVTKRTLAARRNAHFSSAERGTSGGGRFHAAIRKYGRNVFFWEILEKFSSYEEALDGEIRLIDKHKPEYNVLPGGVGGKTNQPSWNRRSVICLETGVIYDAVTIAAEALGADPSDIVKACKYFRTAAGGLHFRYSLREMCADDRVALIREIDEKAIINRRRRSQNGLSNNESNGPVDGRDSLGRICSPLVMARKVICLDDGKHYESASSAARAYDVPKSGVIELCLGRRNRKTIGGKRFAYIEASA